MRKALAALLLTSFLTLPISAHAQTPCGSHEDIVRSLVQGYGERIVVRFIARTGQLIEFMASEDGSTWSMLVTNPRNTQTCMVMGGTDFETFRPFSSPPEITPQEGYSP